MRGPERIRRDGIVGTQRTANVALLIHSLLLEHGFLIYLFPES